MSGAYLQEPRVFWSRVNGYTQKHHTLEPTQEKNKNATYFITVSTNEMLRSLNYGFEHFGQWLRRGRRRRLFQRRRRLPRGRQWRLLAERIVHVEVLVSRLQRHVL